MNYINSDSDEQLQSLRQKQFVLSLGYKLSRMLISDKKNLLVIYVEITVERVEVPINTISQEMIISLKIVSLEDHVEEMPQPTCLPWFRKTTRSISFVVVVQ